MKKKMFFVLLILVLSSSLLFAGAGRDKIGGYVGWPIGFNYSHEFNTFAELDLLVGIDGYGHYRHGIGHGGMLFQLAPLFTVFDPVVDGNHCPLTVGPGFGFTTNVWNKGEVEIDLNCILRWEFFPKNVRNFNFFFEFGPGMGIYTWNRHDASSQVAFSPRGGLGLRYVLD